MANTSGYQVFFIHPDTAEIVGILTERQIESLNFTRLVNQIGEADIEIDATLPVAQYFQVRDLVMEIQRLHPISGQLITEGTYLMRYADRSTLDDGTILLLLKGRSAEVLLERRLILPEDDPTGAGGYSSKLGVASTVMKEFVDNQAINPLLNGDRIIAGLSIKTGPPLGNVIFQRQKHIKLIEVIQECALAGKVDFRVVRTTGLNFEFETNVFGQTGNPYLGERITFSEERLNMSEPRITLDRRDEVTFVYVFGQGPEDDPEIVPYTRGDGGGNRWGRIEDKTDARNNEPEVEAFEGLLLAGESFLEKSASKEILTFKMTDDEIRYYRMRWDLYDTIKAIYAGFEFDYRIVGVAFNVKQGDEDVKITLANRKTAIDPEIAIYARNVEESAFTNVLAKMLGDQRKLAVKQDRIEQLSRRAETAAGLTRKDFTDLPPTPKPTVGIWVNDGRKPGEGAGVGTGVPARWDDNLSKWISNYDGSEVLT